MYRAIGMTCFVSNNLPLVVGPDDYVGTGNRLARVSRVVLGAGGAGLSEPGQANGGSRVTGG